MLDQIVAEGENYALINQSSSDVGGQRRLRLLIRNPNLLSPVRVVECLCVQMSPDKPAEMHFSGAPQEGKGISREVFADGAILRAFSHELEPRALRRLGGAECTTPATEEELMRATPGVMRTIEAFKKVAPLLLDKTVEEQRSARGQQLFEPVAKSLTEGQGMSLVAKTTTSRIALPDTKA